MRSLVRLLPFIRPYAMDSVLSLALLLGVVAADLAIPRLTQRVIDQGILRQDMVSIGKTALWMLGAAAASALFAVANTILSVRVGMGLATDLRSALVRKTQTFSFGNLDRLQTGELLVRSTSDVNAVQIIIQMGLRILTRAPLWMVGSIVLLVLTNLQLAMVMLALAPLIWGLIWIIGARARPLFVSVQHRLDLLNQVLQENLAGVRVVKAFVRDEYENRRFGAANANLTVENVRVMLLLAVLVPTMTLLVNLGIAGVVWFGGRQVIAGPFTVGELVASINYMSYALFPMIMLGGMIGPIAAADASAARIWEVLDHAPEVQNRPHLRPLNGARGRVAFEDVCFSYNHDCQDAVLNGVNLVAEPGQRVAILGATGSGKSSLVHLIPRFYDVDRGRVTLDGVDVRDLPLGVLRAQISIAQQETVLFRGTIRDNIRYGRPQASDEEVVAAARAAQAHDFVVGFPEGYDTLLGQRGVNLSGGQKQRLAIARALLPALHGVDGLGRRAAPEPMADVSGQPTVLILDDSTSAVDVETEAGIHAALESLHPRARAAGGDPGSVPAPLTTFVIAQRISTVLGADKIIVLDRGHVVAEGTHAELIASSPIYLEIYDSQLGDGRAERV